MKRNLLNFAGAGMVLALLTGCSNIGNAPSGASDDELKAKVAQESPLQQIRNLNFAPIPPAQKEQQIKAIEDKYNVNARMQ